MLMVMVLLCEIAAGITVAVMRPQVEQLVKKNMDDTMEQYGSPKSLVTKTWDDLQKNVSTFANACVRKCVIKEAFIWGGSYFKLFTALLFLGLLDGDFEVV